MLLYAFPSRSGWDGIKGKKAVRMWVPLPPGTETVRPLILCAKILVRSTGFGTLDPSSLRRGDVSDHRTDAQISTPSDPLLSEEMFLITQNEAKICGIFSIF
jgi:hypothetical protein